MKRAPLEGLELRAAFQSVKSQATELILNYYVEAELERMWTSTGALSYFRAQKCLLLFRRERQFEHLYHIAASRADLAQALASLDQSSGLPIVTDLVGPSEDVASVAEIYHQNGFEDYVELVRMVRPGGPPPDELTKANVDYAQLAEIPTIVAFLDRQLDPFRDQIPSADEIESAIGRRSILLHRFDGALAGLLFFGDKGRTSTVRYWYVDREFHGRGIGSRLMRTYLREHSSTSRFLLWVVTGNADAIAKYEHYGYRREMLFDQILIRRRESNK